MPIDNSPARHYRLQPGLLLVILFASYMAQAQDSGHWQQADEQLPVIDWGVGLALLGMYGLMRKASARLPLGLFFGVTAGLLYYLALSFAGSGVLELQQAGWIGITPLNGVPRIGWLGLYPTVETLVAQLLLLAPLPFALWWWMKQRKPQPEAAQ